MIEQPQPSNCTILHLGPCNSAMNREKAPKCCRSMVDHEMRAKNTPLVHHDTLWTTNPRTTHGPCENSVHAVLVCTHLGLGYASPCALAPLRPPLLRGLCHILLRISPIFGLHLSYSSTYWTPFVILDLTMGLLWTESRDLKFQ